MSKMVIDIVKDNDAVNKMVLAAKYGQWEKMFSILKNKPYLVNCIPEKRTWAALHQAAYLGEMDPVTRLLEYDTCDALIKTCEDPSSTVEDIAKKRGNNDVAKAVQNNIAHIRGQRFSTNILYFVPRKSGEKIVNECLPLFLLEMAMYKRTVVPKTAHIKTHMATLMKRIFAKEVHNWKTIEEKLHQSLYGFCKAAAEAIRGAKTERDYFIELIRLYTSNVVFKQVNTAVAREFSTGYKPTSDDVALGLFALLLDVTITYWNELTPETGTTYRGIGSDVTNQYHEGDNIMFTTFLSSSKSRSVADGFRGYNGTMMIFDNSVNTQMRPKYIEKYSAVHGEEECLYPVGTEFRITKVELANKTVYFKLLA